MTIILSAIIGILIMYILITSQKNTQNIYLDQTEKTIISMKKDFLKDTINNVFMEIDELRAVKSDNYKKNVEYRLKRFQEKLNSTDEEFIDFFVDRFENDENAQMWTAYLWDHSSSEVLYNSSELNINNIDSAKKSLESLLISYTTVKKGSIEGVFGIKKTYLDDLVKKEIENTIRKQKFSNGSYIWIDEIISYAGGVTH